ncbi:MAG: NfeD family protein [Verrucomicrobiales bacterium]|nr:NfeD family protein [Verrucomicrobiales bacterium]
MDLFIAYVACFGFGLLFSIVSAVAGHLFGSHAGHEADGAGGDLGSGGHAEAGFGGDHMPGIAPLSPTTIASFITAFGGLGMILSRIEATRSPFVSLPLSFLGGFLIAAGVFLMFRAVFARTQSSSESKVAGLAGREATVITPISAGGTGEIAYVDGGVRYTAAARAEGDVAIGTGVTVVIHRIVGNQFYVTRATHS